MASTRQTTLPFVLTQCWISTRWCQRCDHSFVTYGRRLRSVSVTFELINTQADFAPGITVLIVVPCGFAPRPCAHCQPASLSRMLAYPNYGNVTDAVEPHKLRPNNKRQIVLRPLPLGTSGWNSLIYGYRNAGSARPTCNELLPPQN
jgi:hypothetical protein